MPSLKQSLVVIATSLAALESAVEEGRQPTVEALEEHHQALRRALYHHRKDLEALGVTAEDITEIDNAGVVARGGTPKGPAPEDV